MTRNKTYALLLAAVLFACAAAPANSASAAGGQSAPPGTPQSQKIIRTQFIVTHMLLQSLQVRSATDVRDLHTFTYSPGIREQMQEVFNAGGYQDGDNVTIWYRQGTTVALKIRGKPSKKK
jgi:hypothetical protein